MHGWQPCFGRVFFRSFCSEGLYVVPIGRSWPLMYVAVNPGAKLILATLENPRYEIFVEAVSLGGPNMEPCRRTTVEFVIGHLRWKSYFDRNYLKGCDVDRANVELSAPGYNFPFIKRSLLNFWLKNIAARIAATYEFQPQNGLFTVYDLLIGENSVKYKLSTALQK